MVTESGGMAKLNIRLFGPGVVMLEDRSIRPHSAKALALLAFLAVESDRAHSRDKLAGLLWGDGPERSARQSLRQALYSLKTVAGGRLGVCVESGHELLRFVPRPGVDVDVHRFLGGVAGADPRDWRAAAAAYRAPLLEGRVFERCDEFMAWVAAARQRLDALGARNYERIVVERMASADWDGALGDAEAWRDAYPTSETAARQLIRIFAARNDSKAICTEWSRLCRVLERELQAPPAPETFELYQALGGAQQSMAGDESEAESFCRAARAAERVYALGNAVGLYERALQILKSAVPSPLGRYCEVLLCKESVLERLGRRAEQTATIGEAMEVARALGNEGHLAVILLRQTGASAYLGNYAEAADAARQALDIYRRIGDRPGEAEALRELGFVHWRAENHASALHYAREVLALHRRLGDVAGEASALHNLAEIHRGLGSPRQALQWYEQALALHWAARNHEGEILTLFGMANALQQSGDLRGARARYEEALRLSEQHGQRTMQSRALHALAMQYADERELDTAWALMRRAVDVDRAIGYAHALGHDLLDLGRIHLLRGEQAEARAALQEAVVWFRYTEDPEAVAMARARLQDLASGNGARDAAASRRWVKSHLALGEGKVYCEFESPLAGLGGLR